MPLRAESRRILVHGVPVEQIDALLTEFGGMGKAGPRVPLGVAGPVAGWVVVDPGAGLHPYHVHNLALWLLGGPSLPDRLIVLSDGADARASYWLIPDPDRKNGDDALVGWQSDGTSLVVRVPDHLVWRGLTHAQPLIPRDTYLLTSGVPSGLEKKDPRELPGFHAVELPLEALGSTMNPDLEATSRPRKRFGVF